MIRLLSALLLGLVVSLGLFWLMQYMTMNNKTGLKPTDNIRMVEFVRLKRETRPVSYTHLTLPTTELV